MVAPVIRQRPRRCAARNKQSAACPCTDEKTRAPVVPWLTSLSRKFSAAAAACSSAGVPRFLGEGEAIEPFEQVVRRRRQHAVLREVNVRVDQAGQDDRVVVALAAAPRRAPAAGRRRRRARGCGPAGPPPPRRPRGSLSPVSGPTTRGSSPKAQRAAAQDPRCGIGARRHPATRSSMRKRMMRQTLSIAFPCSSSGPLAMRSSKAARIMSLVAPLTAKMKGIPKRSL